MSLAKALPSSVKRTVGETDLEFRRIGLDIWSGFSDYVISERAKRIRSMPLPKGEQALMLKQLAIEGMDMMAVLTEAGTLNGMSWLVCECCITKGVTRNELEQLLPVTQIPKIFTDISDIETEKDAAGEIEGESGNVSSDLKIGVS